MTTSHAARINEPGLPVSLARIPNSIDLIFKSVMIFKSVTLKNLVQLEF